MYRMSNSEFRQYEIAEKHLKDLKLRHAHELKRAYDGINPTISCYDYEEGSIHSESVNPAEYAIFLVELQEEHKRQENWWKLRVNAYNEALQKLTETEQEHLKEYNYSLRESARRKLQEILTNIVSNNPELQRQSVSLEDFEDMEEADRRIEQMSMNELLEGYWDLDQETDEEYLKKQCIYLYEACDWPYSMIGRRLGIPTSRVKKYINTNEINKVVKPQTKSPVVCNIEITYLNSNELEDYRNGKNGGTKWYTYDDYLRMKNEGMNNKEIAIAMGIDSSIFFQRLRFWKRQKQNNRRS